MKKEERIAKEILERLFPDAEIRYCDICPGKQKHDFDVIQRSNVKASVEVTATTRQFTRELQAAIEKTTSDYMLKSTKVQGRWVVFVIYTESRIKRRLADIEACLHEFEKRQIDRFTASTCVDDEELKCLFEKARILGIDWAKRACSQGAQITILPVEKEVFVSSEDYINGRVKELAWKCDNRKKLGQLESDRRILFLVIDEATDYLCWKQIVDYEPKYPPELPPEVTEVLITARNRENKLVVWSGTRKCWKRIAEAIELNNG